MFWLFRVTVCSWEHIDSLLIVFISFDDYLIFVISASIDRATCAYDRNLDRQFNDIIMNFKDRCIHFKQNLFKQNLSIVK